MSKPVLRHVANLWTLIHHPYAKNEWSLAEKLKAIKETGFDGVCWSPLSGLKKELQHCGLFYLGGMSSGRAAEFPKLLSELKNTGAHHVNVQLADDDTLTPEAVELALALMKEGQKLGLEPAIEIHRDTCTETPEKTYALADAYKNLTGQLLPLSWDFSHIAVVKHLRPENYIEKMLVRPNLLQRAQQFHFRPFNGHHAQVPITDGKGKLTPEFKDWLPFAEAVLKCWLDGNQNSGREIFICPELGPLEGGYKLSTFPNSWEDAKRLRDEIDWLWKKLTK
jgi:sugar phosphate isomerase/epimerase